MVIVRCLVQCFLICHFMSYAGTSFLSNWFIFPFLDFQNIQIWVGNLKLTEVGFVFIENAKKSSVLLLRPFIFFRIGNRAQG